MMKQAKTAPAWRGWLRRGLLGLLLACAGWMLWQGAGTPDAAEPQPTSTPAPTQTAQSERSLREEAYDKDRASLETLLDSGAADEQTRAQAAKRLQQMVSDHQSEIAVEEALRGAGYQPVLVLLQNGALTVMLNGENAGDSAAIFALCAAHAGISPENIRIMTAAD